ncbi:hypothetical protein CPter291_2439 [Collimonas pratensis]|uniref:Uncharacterized protein n=1 Tax=Collimonas pratensis TaxID=279113 RepID=A0ABM5Z6E0_9BURK|nr:hypothetical protein CPter291_2439 [Collimonas pratensis]
MEVPAALFASCAGIRGTPIFFHYRAALCKQWVSFLRVIPATGFTSAASLDFT